MDVMCPHCKDYHFNFTRKDIGKIANCSFCGCDFRVIRATKFPAAEPEVAPAVPLHPARRPFDMGWIIMLPSFLGTAFLWLWMPTRRAMDRPGDTIAFTILLVVLATATLASIEASAVRPLPRSASSGFATFVMIVLLWFVSYPWYMHDRTKAGLQNMLASGLGSVLLFIATVVFWAHHFV